VKISEEHCKKNEDGSIEYPTCPVCIEMFKKGAESIFLPCGHIYHPDFITTWLKDHNTCPNGGYDLPT